MFWAKLTTGKCVFSDIINGMLYVVFMIVGYFAGVLINVLADYLPLRRVADVPPSFFRYAGLDNLALVRHFSHDGVQKPTHKRALWVELGMVVLLGILPAFSPTPILPTLLIHALFITILVLIIVIDLEHRLILHIVTFPTTIGVILLSLLVQDDIHYNWKSAIVGAIGGFLLFYLFYWFGRLVFGPGALGFGDVTLSMTMGAMLGFHRIFFALIMGIFLGGILNILPIIFRKRNMQSYVAYGPYLAIAGIIMIIWGTQIFEWYVR